MDAGLLWDKASVFTNRVKWTSVYVYVSVCVCVHIYIYRVSREEWTKLRESVP